jgi:hypothetical protein
MAKATHTIIPAVCYFLVPLALCVGLILIGTFIAGYLFTTSVWIAIVVLCGFFVAAFSSLVRKSHVKSFILICSVLFIGSCYWYFVGPDRIRRYLYVAEIKFTPNFDKKCVPSGGILLLNGDTLRLCSTHDFNMDGWIDSIVKIDGSYPEGRLIDDINSRGIKATVGNELNNGFAPAIHVTGQNLSSDYYLIRYHMCGNALPYC